MHVKDAQFVIYVKDLERSIRFYQKVFQREASFIKSDYAEIEIYDRLKLGIVNESNIIKVLGTKVPHPMIANGIPRNEIYIYVDDPKDYYQQAINNGAISISEFEMRSWGHYVAYVMDPDGHIIAFASK